MVRLILTSSWDNFLRLLGALIAFVFVMILTYFVTRFVAKYQRQLGTTNNFQIIETYRLSNTKCLELLRVGRKYVVLCVCKDTVTYITELEEEEIVLEGNGDTQISFKNIFENMKEEYHKKYKNEDIESDEKSEEDKQ